jgi:molecular chaperone GrpE (heat shock protein)
MSNYLLLIILSVSCVLSLLTLVIFIFSFRKIIKKIKSIEVSLQNEIKSSVQSKFIEITPETKNLIDLATEAWRIESKISKIDSRISEIQKKSLENSAQKIKRIIDQYDLEVRDYTGTKYNPGITGIEVISVEKNKDAIEDTVKETLEPAILFKGQIVKKAKVIIISSKN